MKIAFRLTLLLIFFSIHSNAQVLSNGSGRNAISTSVPFLTISPDARSSAMGEAGVALDDDANATFWNPSKLAFINNTDKLSISYSPWLRQVSSGSNLAYLSYAHRLNERSAVGVSFRYFNMGDINLYDSEEVGQGSVRPNEFSVDASFARRMGENFSLAVSLRYIRSNLYQGTLNGIQSQAGNAVATDVSFYYRHPANEPGRPSTFAVGVNVSNLGSKISYVKNGTQYFLPANLKIGASKSLNIDDLSQLTLAFDVNKLLVPTPPLRDATGNIISGRDNNRSVVSGIFGSFNDAPGGFKEELKEVMLSPGVEYVYNKQFALRAGYFYDAPSKGDRQYITLGTGFKVDDFNFDLSYLAATQRSSALANTLRFSLVYSFGQISRF